MLTRFNKAFLDDLSAKARASERKRMHYDLRDTPEDGSMRMLNAIEPGTFIPVHRHTMTSEDVLVVRGECEEVLYSQVDDHLVEAARIHMQAGTSEMMCHVPQGQFHTCISLAPDTIIYEAKNTRYDPHTTEDIWNGHIDE